MNVSLEKLNNEYGILLIPDQLPDTKSRTRADILIVLDDSGSMRYTPVNTLAEVKMALSELGLPMDTSVALVQFSASTRVKGSGSDVS